MKPKAKIYIDGANMFYTQKKLKWFFDWKKIKEYLKEKWDILEMRYYTGVKPDDEKMKELVSTLFSLKRISVNSIFNSSRTCGSLRGKKLGTGQAPVVHFGKLSSLRGRPRITAELYTG